MEVSNLVASPDGGVNCLVNHSELGQIPYTARESDPDEFGKEVWQAILAIGVPEIEPNIAEAHRVNLISDAARAECARRINEVCTITDQLNLSMASQLGKLTSEQQIVLSAGHDWIRSMQATWRRFAVEGGDIYDDANWPAAPESARELAAEF